MNIEQAQKKDDESKIEELLDKLVAQLVDKAIEELEQEQQEL